MDSLLEKLLQYSKQDYYPMHMPGHKRNVELLKGFNPYEIDITEIDGFDNLHHAQDVILELIKRVEQLYQSEKSYLLINGSTVGILAGISACVKKGDRILMARNCHKAVYNAVILNELNPVYLYPQNDGVYGIAGGILPEKIEELLITYPDTKLVVLTSPTYEGILSDMKRIVEICHQYKVPVLVDEAHGAHLGFSKQFPENSVSLGADLVIHSIHKTLPAFTQTAVMHVNGTLVKTDEVETYLGIYETSSPSYLLMAGIDQCMRLLETRGKELFEIYYKNLMEFYREMSGLKHLKVMQIQDYEFEERKKNGIYKIDPSKILISVKNTNITGSKLASILLETYKIQLEMSSLEYGLAMTSICDTKDGFIRLRDALYEIDNDLIMEDEPKTYQDYALSSIECKLEQSMIPYDAMHSETEVIPLQLSVGRTAAKHIMVYPPGIPVVAAGEQISSDALQIIQIGMKSNLEVLGLNELPDHEYGVVIVNESDRRKQEQVREQ